MAATPLALRLTVPTGRGWALTIMEEELMGWEVVGEEATEDTDVYIMNGYAPTDEAAEEKVDAFDAGEGSSARLAVARALVRELEALTAEQQQDLAVMRVQADGDASGSATWALMALISMVR